MKLTDLKKPTLQEALNLEWVFDLHETLNARFDDEAWHQEGRNQVGIATLGDETFKIILQPVSYPLDGITYRAINAAFQKIVNGRPSEDLQWNSKNASQVVGAITNALLERVALYDFDAVIFMASDNIEKRMQVYNQIARRRWSQEGLGTSIENVEVGDGRRATILLSKELARYKADAFVDHLRTIKKL
jgi:hypothetical protein